MSRGIFGIVDVLPREVLESSKDSSTAQLIAEILAVYQQFRSNPESTSWG